MASSEDYPLYPAAVILPLLALLTLVLDTPPFIWHLRNRNVAASSLVGYIMILNFTSFINALIWPTDDPAHFWDGRGLCDIEVRIFVYSTVAIPGALASIMRSLAVVLDADAMALVPSKSQRMRRTVFEVTFCFGFPTLLMIVYYVVQPLRYYIWGISGCNWGVDNSWLSVVLIYVWPTIVSLVAAYYSVVVIVRLFKYRRDIVAVLELSNTTKSRFLRLFCLSIVLVTGTVPVQIYVLVVNISVQQHPFSWSTVHGSDWNSAIMVPSEGIVIFDRWIRLAMGFLVFLFFGTGREATGFYQSWLTKLHLTQLATMTKRSWKGSGTDSMASSQSPFAKEARAI